MTRERESCPFPLGRAVRVRDRTRTITRSPHVAMDPLPLRARLRWPPRRPLVPGRRHALQSPCRHCFISCSPHNHRFGFLDLETVRRVLDESVALGVKEYYFTGGEPFLNRDMVAILELTLAVRPGDRADQRHRLQGRMAAPAARGPRRRRRTAWSSAFPSTASPRPSNDPVRGDGTFERILRGVRHAGGARLPADHHRGAHPRRPGRRVPCSPASSIC